ncbi:MAG TPA: FAD:protein FMN transferase [Candidatus Limnocylindrales bacterium]|nr:FAD:protein FMN transferase [Candidatus Limnocylindrales bacterium]
MSDDVLEAAWRAIGTEIRVVVAGGPLAPARAAVERVVAAADAAYSRFRRDSELSRIVAADGRPALVSPLLGRAIDEALRAAALTGGIVDPTIGRTLRLAGYDADFAVVEARSDPIVLRLTAAPGWRAVEWDPARRRLRVPAGIELDLGSTGKALISDLAAAAACEELPTRAGVLVSAGGDIATAGTAPDGGWHVLMAEDSGASSDEPGEVVAIAGGALATSSTTVRRWRRGDVVLHHLVDPRTGRPAEGPWRTASAVAATCVDANIATTAAIILGSEAIPWLERTGLPARLVAVDGSVRRVNGWPATETRPVAS